MNSRQPILVPLLVLYGLTIAAQLISLAYGRIDEEREFAAIVLPSVLFLSALTLPAIALGIGIAAYSGTAVAEAEVTSSNAGGDAPAQASPEPDSRVTPTTEQGAEGGETDAGAEDDGDFSGDDSDLDDAANDDLEDPDLDLDRP